MTGWADLGEAIRRDGPTEVRRCSSLASRSAERLGGPSMLPSSVTAASPVSGAQRQGPRGLRAAASNPTAAVFRGPLVWSRPQPGYTERRRRQLARRVARRSQSAGHSPDLGRRSDSVPSRRNSPSLDKSPLTAAGRQARNWRRIGAQLGIKLPERRLEHAGQRVRGRRRRGAAERRRPNDVKVTAHHQPDGSDATGLVTAKVLAGLLSTNRVRRRPRQRRVRRSCSPTTPAQRAHSADSADFKAAMAGMPAKTLFAGAYVNVGAIVGSQPGARPA